MTKNYMRIMQKKEADRTIKEMVYLNACNCIYQQRRLTTVEKCGLGAFTCNAIWNTAVHDVLVERGEDI